MLSLYVLPADVALSSGCISPEPGSPLQGSSDGTGMLGSFGGSLSATLTVSSVEYLGPEEELPPPGRTAQQPYKEN